MSFVETSSHLTLKQKQQKQTMKQQQRKQTEERQREMNKKRDNDSDTGDDEWETASELDSEEESEDESCSLGSEDTEETEDDSTETTTTTRITKDDEKALKNIAKLHDVISEIFPSKFMEEKLRQDKKMQKNLDIISSSEKTSKRGGAMKSSKKECSYLWCNC